MVYVFSYVYGCIHITARIFISLQMSSGSQIHNSSDSVNSNSSSPTPFIFDRDIARWYVPQSCLHKLNNPVIGKSLGSGVFGRVYDLCENDICNKIVKLVPLQSVMSLDDKRFIDEYLYNELPLQDYKNHLHNRNELNSYILRRRHGTAPDDYDRQIEEKFNFRASWENFSAIIDVTASFEREVLITRQAAFLGISPKFYDAFICPDILQYPEGSLISMGFIIQEKWRMSLEQYQQLTGNDIPLTLIDKLRNLIKTMHMAGIVHKDLHPGNIVLQVMESIDDNGDKIYTPTDIALIDFGMSRLKDHLSPAKFIELSTREDSWVNQL